MTLIQRTLISALLLSPALAFLAPQPGNGRSAVGFRPTQSLILLKDSEDDVHEKKNKKKKKDGMEDYEAARQAFERLAADGGLQRSMGKEPRLLPMTANVARLRQTELKLLKTLKDSDQAIDPLVELWVKERSDAAEVLHKMMIAPLGPPPGMDQRPPMGFDDRQGGPPPMGFDNRHHGPPMGYDRDPREDPRNERRGRDRREMQPERGPLLPPEGGRRNQDGGMMGPQEGMMMPPPGPPMMMMSPNMEQEEQVLRQMMADYGDDGWVEPHGRLAVLLFMRGEYMEVLDLCDFVLYHKPWHFEVAQLLGITLLRLGDLPAAIRVTRKHVLPPMHHRKRRKQWVERMTNIAQERLDKAEAISLTANLDRSALEDDECPLGKEEGCAWQ